MTKKRYTRTIAGPRLDPKQEGIIAEVTAIVQKARSELGVEDLAAHLADDAVYEAQTVLEPIIGKSAVVSYLRERFDFLRGLQASRDIGALVYGRVDLPKAADYPCLIFLAEGKRQALWVVSVDSESKISRIDILTVAPTPDEARIDRSRNDVLDL